MARAKDIRGARRGRRAGYIAAAILAACCGLPLLLVITGILGGQGPSGQPLAIPAGQAGTYNLKNLVVRTADGEELALGDTGGKPRVLVAVATWCGTCAAALMSIREGFGFHWA